MEVGPAVEEDKMRFRTLSESRVGCLMLSAALALLFLPTSGSAQQQAQATKNASLAASNSGTTSAANAGANSKATPRTPDGHPDLDGIWYHSEPGPPVELRKGGTVVYQFP